MRIVSHCEAQILTECRDPKQVEWVKSYYEVFKQLTEYVKTTFPQGIPWNPKGVSAEEALKSIESSAAPPAAPHPTSAGGPAPPPPPGPPPPPLRFDDAPKAAPAADAGGLGAVFNELNKGSDVTKGLKKVTADQMTHKNPSLRAGATVPTRSDSSSSVTSASRGKSPAPPGKKPKPEAMRTKKPPVKKLDGNKWIIVSLKASISYFHANAPRKIMLGKASLFRSKPPSRSPSSSVDATRPLLSSRARRTQSQLTTLHACLSSLIPSSHQST